MIRALLLAALLWSAIASAQSATWEVHFSPGHDCTAAVVAQLAKAQRTVYVLAYGFTSPEIAQALVSAEQRGVQVQVVLDRSNRTARYSEAALIERGGIPVAIDGKHPIAHNKVIVVDGETVISGSYNFTRAAEHNGENLLVLHSAELAAAYLADWQRHRGHSDLVAP